MLSILAITRTRTFGIPEIICINPYYSGSGSYAKILSSRFLKYVVHVAGSAVSLETPGLIGPLCKKKIGAESSGARFVCHVCLSSSPLTAKNLAELKFRQTVK